MSDASTPATSEPTAAAPFPKAVLLLGAGGILLAIGSLLPWVTIGSVFSISGVDARWGLGTLLAGLGAIAVAVQFGTGRLMARSADKVLAIIGLALGVLSFAIAIYVGFAIRDSVAEAESESSSSAEESTGRDELDESFDEFAKGLEELFKVGTGAGVYVTAIGGLAVAAGGGVKLKDRNADE